MKLGKKIVFTLALLLIVTVSGISGLHAVSQLKQTEVLDNGRSEQGHGETEEEITEIATTEIATTEIRTTETATTEITTTEIATTEIEADEYEPVDLEDYSQAPADNGCPYYVKVNRQQNVVTVYELDEEGYYRKPIKAMVCSVGMNNATPTGTYQMTDKYTWRQLVGGVYGQYACRIQGPFMFHSVPYYSMDKGALETEEYNKLGEAASLGCIRLSVADAKWIYDNCPAGTIVTIYDSEYAGPLGTPVAEEINVQDERAGWDPTDPDAANPWNTEEP